MTRSSLSRRLSVVLSAALAVLSACSPDDASEDAVTACKDLCTSAGFQDSRVDTQPNELNCFCSGGNGSVPQTACAQTCGALGRTKGSTLKSNNDAVDACQCS